MNIVRCLNRSIFGKLGYPRHLSSQSTPCVPAINRLGVIGVGQMGLGIGLVVAQRVGIPVTLVDTKQVSIDKSLELADKLLAKDVSKQRISQEQADHARSLLNTTTSIDALSEVDFVIEAVPEIETLKFSIFESLATICPRHAILATNTSSISITRIAAAADANSSKISVSSRVVATHFMNPVPIQKGVEVIRGLQTSQNTFDIAVNFCKAMGKIPSESKDYPGFIANRILMPYINEAIFCLESGIGSREDIDNIMKNGTNVPMGPLQLADFIGIDTCLAIMQVIESETCDSKYRPCVLLKKMVAAGWLGKKSGKGFYEY